MSTRVAHAGFGTTTQGLVSLVLRAGGGRVDHVLCAIRDDNASSDLLVIDHGETVQIWAPGSLRVTVGALRWHLGHGFGLSQMESMIVSSRGALNIDDDGMTLVSEGRRPVALQWTSSPS